MDTLVPRALVGRVQRAGLEHDGQRGPEATWPAVPRRHYAACDGEAFPVKYHCVEYNGLCVELRYDAQTRMRMHTCIYIATLEDCGTLVPVRRLMKRNTNLPSWSFKLPQHTGKGRLWWSSDVRGSLHPTSSREVAQVLSSGAAAAAIYHLCAIPPLIQMLCIQ